MNARAATEDEIGTAFDRLAELQARARSNLQAQGRDPGAALVLVLALRDSLALRGIQPARFRLVLSELERRGLAQLDGPFIALASERARARA